MPLAESLKAYLKATDILMPRMDGYQLCREWKNDPDLCSAPVVFYTATYTAREDREFADEVGADLFIVKPTDPMQLLAAVEKLTPWSAARNLAGGGRVVGGRRHRENRTARSPRRVGWSPLPESHMQLAGPTGWRLGLY